jgi:hypothetical protein
VADASLGVDAELPAAVDALGGRGEHLANPVGGLREEGCIRIAASLSRRQPPTSPSLLLAVP